MALKETETTPSAEKGNTLRALAQKKPFRAGARKASLSRPIARKRLPSQNLYAGNAKSIPAERTNDA